MSIFYGSRYETATVTMVADANAVQHATAFRNGSPLAAPISYLAYTVRPGDSIDVLAYQIYQREDYYWLIGDANPGVSLIPLIPGTILRIPNVVG